MDLVYFNNTECEDLTYAHAKQDQANTQRIITIYVGESTFARV
jgi:hypothetical protein